MAVVRHKEAIHSGHFMVSDFEAEDEPAEIPETANEEGIATRLMHYDEVKSPVSKEVSMPEPALPPLNFSQSIQAQSIIDISLNKLFQRMSIAYRQKLTSPKWNHFKGLKLRWKDKIRLNNVIWRCWHMQFIKGRNRLLCAFANPLEIDYHNMMEGGTLLEGKYWKRKLRTITNEYKRWRMFYYKNQIPDGSNADDLFLSNTNYGSNSNSSCKDDFEVDQLLLDSDFFVDALFSSLGEANHSFAVPFPNPRDVNKSTTNADFIQPGLVQLQPNLDDLNIGDLEWLNTSTTTITTSTVSTQPRSLTLKCEETSSYTQFQNDDNNNDSFGIPLMNSNSLQEQDSMYDQYNMPPPPPTQHFNKRSPKYRILHRGSNLPYTKSECSRPSTSWSAEKNLVMDSNSELLQLLKTWPQQYNNDASQANIPPPPPHAAPQPQTRTNFRGKTDTVQYQEHRRNVHINAEQKRRCTIKNGFEIMRTLIPSLNGNSGLKISKAALLHKGGDYLQQLKSERNQLASEIDNIRSQITSLTADITSFQNMLPTVRSTGPTCRNQMKEMFDIHVYKCTHQNWKYWIFSLLMRLLLESFETSVGSGNFEDLFRTSLSWLDQHCTMRHLRTMAIDSLTKLSISTDILTHPERLPQTAMKAVWEEEEMRRSGQN